MPATNVGISISVTYRVGAIALRTGMPPAEDPWGWSCGFYPGSHPRECTDGTAATFDQARAEFEAAWRVFLSHRTEADFQGGALARRNGIQSMRATPK